MCTASAVILIVISHHDQLSEVVRNLSSIIAFSDYFIYWAQRINKGIKKENSYLLRVHSLEIKIII